MLDEIKIYDILKKYYNRSTINNNIFEKAINRIKWEDTFKEDDEYYFIRGNITLVVPFLNPFDVKDKFSSPCIIHKDGSQIYFE